MTHFKSMSGLPAFNHAVVMLSTVSVEEEMRSFRRVMVGLAASCWALAFDAMQSVWSLLSQVPSNDAHDVVARGRDEISCGRATPA
jgi:hypothetical protein